MNLPRISSPRTWMAMGCAIAAIAACGGGVGSGGTGMTDSVGVGTVNGFGSVVIDGVHVDDRQVASLAETAPGVDTAVDARLGDRVEVTFGSDGVARSLRIEASLVGQVASVDTSNPSAVSFQSLGQAVSINTQASAGPVTQLSGYAAPADVQVGDVVEVHGALRTSAGGEIQATRIEKRSTLPAYLRVSGVVTSLAGGNSPGFRLGSLSVNAGSAQVSPAGATLANGQVVVVLARPTSLGSPVNGQPPSLGAASVRIASLARQGAQVYASGVISQLDAAGHRFTLDGQRVDFAQATLAPAGSTLSDGQYVQVRGSTAADGTLSATQVTRRDGESEPEAELKGTIVGFDAASNTFEVRGVRVNSVAAAIESCPSGGLRNGLYVEIEGQLGSNGVVATEIHCEDEPSGAVIEREGTAASVNAAALTFVLTTQGGPLTVTWSTLTVFKGVTAPSLSGQQVEVEGTLVNGALQATKISADD